MAANKGSGIIRWVLTVGILAALGFGAWYFFLHKAEAAVQYRIATVARGELVQTVTASGTLNPVVNVQVGSQISGRISKLYVDFNSPVTSNQIIAEIDPSTYRANVQRAQGDLSSARASLELALVEARRAGELFTNKLISASEYDATIANLHQAEATTEIREAALSSAQVDLSRCTIYSPVDGVVISRSVDVGQTVAASLSAPVLFQIASDLTKMQIDANVAEADIGGVAEGQEVEFTVDAFPFRTFYGKVTQVRNAPLTVQNVVTYDTVIEVNNADMKLKPGMTANVSIVINRRADALRIPNAALRYRPSEEILLPMPTNELAQAVTAGQTDTNRPAGSGEPGRRRGNRGGRGGGSGEMRWVTQTVYLWPGGDPEKPPTELKLKPVKVRLGITDGIATEAMDGLADGDVLVTGSTAPAAATASTQNPFGGGRPGGFRRF